MSGKIHIINSVEPIVWKQQDQMSICGYIVEQAVPANIVPDPFLCSVGGIASTFGHHMCKHCQLMEDPPDGWVYFCLSKEDAKKLKQMRELAEVS